MTAVAPSRKPRILVATHDNLLSWIPGQEVLVPGSGLEGRRPSAVAWDLWVPDRAWSGTTEDGVLRSDDGGRSWQPGGLDGQAVMAVTASPSRRYRIWVGTEPSAVWHTDDGGGRWKKTSELSQLPSSPEWAFPPRPETHHVRWIVPHPSRKGRLWVAVEAGALVSTTDGGGRWRDRVRGGPRDTHELAIHPRRPRTLRVAAGDGYFQSEDGGATWLRPREGLEVGYLRSVAIAPESPEIVVVSAASGPRSAYVAGRSDGRLYRRVGGDPWQRVESGWPDPPDTIAPLVRPGTGPGEFWAADERGLHRSLDGGLSWQPVATFPSRPHHLRGLTVRGLPG